MKTFKIELFEEVEYAHEVKVELPDDVNDETVWDLVDQSTSKDDIYSIVKSFGGSIIDFCEDQSGDTDISVTDVEDFKEE